VSRHLGEIVGAGDSRSVGSPGNERARSYCAAVLRDLGYSVETHPFEFSALPGILGAPIAGVMMAIAFGVAWILAVRGDRTAAGLCISLAVAGLWLGGRTLGRGGVLTFPLMRRRGVNLSATRRGVVPTVWLVAHVDSKWQPVPTLIRSLSVVLVAGAVLLSLAALAIPSSSSDAWRLPLGVGMVATLPLMLSFVRGGSPGALDNASGVAAVLVAAEIVPPTIPIGVLVTDAEELALAGARAWCLGRPRSVALNCDGVDDSGPITIMTVAGTSAGVVEAMKPTHQTPTGTRVIRLIPGVLTDSVAFSDAGWDGVTLSRGTIRTLGRIHTMEDSLERLEGSAIEEAAAVLCRGALEIERRIRGGGD
jgi:hypothetical protein